jgi:peptidoglycan/LPS O-acetylase OafA/YrhL
VAEVPTVKRVKHRDDIQGLRGVAVLLVVLDHASVPGFRGGYVGVDVFFVLSGYLITRLLLADAISTGRISLIRFYVRRAKRILPAATLTLLTTIVAGNLLLNFIRAREIATDTIWAALFAANVHFAHLGTDYFAQWQPQSPVQHYWTLAVEEQFYIVWPAALSLILVGAVGGWRPRRAHATLVDTMSHSAVLRVLCVATPAMALSLAWSIYYTPRSPTDAYFSTFTRAWELGIGAILACATLTAWQVRSRYLGLAAALGGWAGLVAVAWAAATYSSSTIFPGAAALVPVIGAALLIAAGMHRQRPRYGASAALSVAPLRYVGDRSYALYLRHWPVLLIYAA